MTLHDRLKEIIRQYYDDWYEHTERGGHPDPTDSTIAAIIQAVAERLPGEQWFTIDNMVASIRAKGWNAYREEVRKVLETK